MIQLVILESRIAAATAAFRDSAPPLLGIETVWETAANTGDEIPLDSFPMTRQHGFENGMFSMESPSSVAPKTGISFIFSRYGTKSVYSTGILKMLPIVDCTTLGENASAVSGEQTMPDIPNQSQVLMRVPKLPGS